MKTVLFYLILMVVFPFSDTFASVETNTDNKPAKIAKIEVGVKSREVRVLENSADDKYWPYRAATASPKNSIGLPFGRKGVIHKIVLNPDFHPTDAMKKEARDKGRKLKDYYPPNSKGNPLGKLKMFIGFHNARSELYNSSLGIHTTTSPNSIGKRVSHGCTRQGDADAFEIARVILKQDGRSDEEISALFERAKKNPKKSITIKVANGPEVVYLND
jgi:lipoprotein-anchoring transpeptidase ErfK/SrfK